MDEYIMLDYAARLENVEYNAFRKRVQREREKYCIRTKKRDYGFKPLVYIAVDSLSPPARQKWKEEQKLKELTEVKGLTEEINKEHNDIERPWYVDTDIDWYIDTWNKNYNKAIELRKIIKGFLSYEDKDKTRFADDYAMKYLGKGQRTLYRYTKAYLEAVAWRNKLEKETGGEYEFFEILCLCRKPKELGNFPSFSEEVKTVIKNIWFNKDFASNLGTIEMLYEKLQAVSNVNGWDKIPSYASVARYLNYLMNDEGMRNAYYLASKGMRNYKNKTMVKASRDTSSVAVMEIAMGDEHTFDCWVSYKQPNGNVIAIKPRLVAWVDIRSRYILGDIICKNANSDILKQSLLKMMYQPNGGVPKYVYIDNGKDYTAKTMTGRNRNDRGGMDFDEEVKGFYRSIGIEDDHRALPYEPWSKGQIERFFGTVCNGFTRWLKSYTGTLTGSKTSDKVDKNIRDMLEKGKLLTIEEFYIKWSEWLNNVYVKREHGGLRKAGEAWNTPLAMFTKAERYIKAAPPKSYATILMMKSENVLVRNIGIVRKGFEYRSDELCDYIGQRVDIKFDPDDMATLYIFKNGKKVCEAYSQELLQIAPKVTQKALEEHIKMQKRQISRDRERLSETQIPLEDINADYVGFSSVTGGIDLMIGKGEKKAKVVSLPDSKTYRDGFRKKNNEQAESEYINNNALEALRKLKAISE